MTIIVLLISLDAAGFKIDSSVSRNTKRKGASNQKHLSVICHRCGPATSLLGYRLGVGAQTVEKTAVHNTALLLGLWSTWSWLTALSIFQVFFSLRCFSSPLPANSGKRAFPQVFARVTAWKLLITNAEKNKEETYTARTWVYQTL